MVRARALAYGAFVFLFNIDSLVRRLGEDKDLICTWLSCAPETRRALALDKDSNPRLEPAVDVWALGTMVGISIINDSIGCNLSPDLRNHDRISYL